MTMDGLIYLLEHVLDTCGEGLEVIKMLEVLDLGAGAGIIPAVARVVGAPYAVGIEMKNQQGGFFPLLEILEDCGVSCENTIGVVYGKAIAECDALPSLCESTLQKCVISFCEGWNADDREKMFSLVASDAKVWLFTCSLGTHVSDPYYQPNAIVDALGTRQFEHKGHFTVNMCGSGSVKQLHVFLRISV